jgi:hypothetical protein
MQLEPFGPTISHKQPVVNFRVDDLIMKSTLVRHDEIAVTREVLIGCRCEGVAHNAETPKRMRDYLLFPALNFRRRAMGINAGQRRTYCQLNLRHRVAKSGLEAFCSQGTVPRLSIHHQYI